MNAPPTPDFRPLRGGRSGAGFSDARARGLGRGAWAALLGLFVIAVALRAIGLGQQSLWVDEAFSYEYAKPDGPLPFADIFDNLHGPLHALLLHLWMKLAGHGEAAVRLPSLIASLLAWAAFWLYARRAWGARVAWTAGALLAVAPFHIWYAQECRNYSLLILFAVLAEWAFHRLTARRPEAGALAGGPAAPSPPARAYAGYGLALLAGFLSNLSMAFFLLQHAVRLFLTARPAGGVRRRILWTWALVALCLLPWAISFYEYQVRPSRLLSTEAVPAEERLREETTATPLGVPYTFYAFATGFSFGPATRDLWQLGPVEAVRRSAGPIALAAVVFGFLWLYGIRSLWREDRRAALDLLIWQILPLFVLLYIADRNVKVINPRYVASMYPAFVLTLVLGPARAWAAASRARGSPVRGGAVRAQEAPRAGPAGPGAGAPRPGAGAGGRISRWAWAAYALALGISVVAVGRAYALERYHKEDYRSASRYLLRELSPGDAFVSLAVDLPLRNYYMRAALRGRAPVPWQDLGRLVNWRGRIALKGQGPDSYEEKLLAAWEPGRRLFVFLAREWVTDPGGILERDLRRRGDLVAEASWPGTRVLVLERRGDGDGRAAAREQARPPGAERPAEETRGPGGEPSNEEAE